RRRRGCAQDDVGRAALPPGGTAGTHGRAHSVSRLYCRQGSGVGREPARHRAPLAPRAQGAGCKCADHRLRDDAMTTVSLSHLNSAGKADFVAALGDIYEQAPWVAEAVHGKRPFASLNELHEAMTAAIRDASAEQRIALLKGHPDLAGKAARAGAMTADSKAEQASAGLDRLSEAGYAALQRFNEPYRKKFGIPFIVCVRRHGKESILRQFERRLQNGAAAETKAALSEVFRIGALRLDLRIEAPDKLKVHGRLSTHVLDTHAGHAAAGVT